MVEPEYENARAPRVPVWREEIPDGHDQLSVGAVGQEHQRQCPFSCYDSCSYIKQWPSEVL